MWLPLFSTKDPVLVDVSIYTKTLPICSTNSVLLRRLMQRFLSLTVQG